MKNKIPRLLADKIGNVRKNPASPDMPTSKLVAWSITNLVFLMKNKILRLLADKIGNVRKNPASPDTPTSKLVAWSITNLVFLMKNKILCYNLAGGFPPAIYVH